MTGDIAVYFAAQTGHSRTREDRGFVEILAAEEVETDKPNCAIRLCQWRHGMCQSGA